MKIKHYYIGLLALALGVASCKKDNYKEPTSRLSGKVHYKGEAINVEYDRVPFELYQYGFGRVGAIGGVFDQDGKYSMLLFDGQYKFIIPNNQGPFLWKKLANGNPDSLTIDLKGSQTIDIEVTPYYMMRDVNLTAAAGKVTGTFKAEKIITDANAKNIERVALFLNKSQFVSASGDYYVATTSINGGDITNLNNISISTNIPTMTPTQNYVFARIGLKISGVEDWLYSPVSKFTF